MVYDNAQNITWLKDANYIKTSGYNADGSTTWYDAQAWAAQLVYGGKDDWRLPTALNADGSGPCYAYNCTGSEMGHLFYGDIDNGLGGTAGQSITTSHNANYGLFKNIQSDRYWSSTANSPNPNVAWIFYTTHGFQDELNKAYGAYVWAVRDGDVAPPVPLPAAIWLFGSALSVLVASGLRNQRRR